MPESSEELLGVGLAARLSGGEGIDDSLRLSSPTVKAMKKQAVEDGSGSFRKRKCK
ncbi:hypothetical protein MRX96_041984, partial [Rhipicephalus microplus]